jgi:hypothetical protein
MQTVPTAKANVKAFYAMLDETHGVLTKVHGTMYFMSDAGEITEIEPQHCPFLMPLGEMGLCDTQALMDRMHGTAAWIATHRQQEVR